MDESKKLCKIKESVLSMDVLEQCFTADYEKGVLIWKVKNSYRVNIGDVAGGFSQSSGYSRVCVYGIRYKLHRIIFFMYHGWLPDEVDHFDGIRENNSISNLRPATSKQNSYNQKTRNSASGVKGVSLYKDNKRWIARICVDYKSIHLGIYPSIEGAKGAYIEAAKKYFGEYASSGE